jgi:hypothetical protein
MKIATKSRRPADTQLELAPQGISPSFAVALDLLDRKHAVIPQDDDTDEDFDASKGLLTAVLNFARKD